MSSALEESKRKSRNIFYYLSKLTPTSFYPVKILKEERGIMMVTLQLTYLI